MSFHYCLYGLNFSTSWAFKQLSEHSDNTLHFNQSFNISLGDTVSGLSLVNLDWQLTHGTADQDSGVKVWQCGGWVKMDFYRNPNESLCFYVHKSSSDVLCSRPESISHSDIESFLLGPVMGYLLRLHGAHCLHASVLNLPQGAIALIGDKGQGKSTTAAALLEAGAHLLADDIAALFWQDSKPWVHPGYPAVRLTEQTLKSNGLNPDDYTSVLSVGDKRYVSLSSSNEIPGDKWQFCPESKPLKAIYILDERIEEHQSAAISTLSPSQALMYLAPHGYAASILDTQGRKAEFANMAHLSRQVVVKKLNCPNNLQKLPEVAKAIFADMRQSELASAKHSDCQPSADHAQRS